MSDKTPLGDERGSFSDAGHMCQRLGADLKPGEGAIGEEGGRIPLGQTDQRSADERTGVVERSQPLVAGLLPVRAQERQLSRLRDEQSRREGDRGRCGRLGKGDFRRGA